MRKNSTIHPLAAVTMPPEDTLSHDPVIRERGIARREQIARNVVGDVRHHIAQAIRGAVQSGVMDDDALLSYVADLVGIDHALAGVDEAIACIAHPSPPYARETEGAP
jgi:hypothetical protein